MVAQEFADEVVVWGSSYSASLVFRLATEYPSVVSGVIAFSPASGGPMIDCRAQTWAEDVASPALVLHPASEMERESSAEQRDTLTEAGADFRVVENGIHGSSMLFDARTGYDMSDTRMMVIEWLRNVAKGAN